MRRKSLVLLLGLSMALSLVGCNGKSTKSGSGDLKLAEYKGLAVYEKELEVDDAYDSTIQSMLSQFSTTDQVKEGKVKKTDKVNIDYVGTIDGFAFEGGTSQGYTLDIGNSNFIEGFAEGLVGKKIGDKVTLNLTFPEDYANTTKDADGKEMSLAGKDVVFEVTLNYKEVTNTPEYTDDFVKEHFSAIATTTSDFDKYLKKRIQITNAMNGAWKEFLDSCEVKSYPSNEVESYEKVLNDQYVQQLQQYYQTDLKTYLESCSMSQADWDKEINKSSKEYIKQKMVIDQIAKEAKVAIKGDSEAYKKKAEALVQLNNLGTVEAAEKQYGKEMILDSLNYEAVQEYIFDNMKKESGERPTEAVTDASADSSADSEDATAEETTKKSKKK
jgi:trigger factor